MAFDDEFEQLRAERDEWRRRAEVAEAVALERLARAEAAERALRTAEQALAARPTPQGTQPVDPDPGLGTTTPPAEQPRPATLRERWRRYTETIN
jgi:hypothetical protein